MKQSPYLIVLVQRVQVTSLDQPTDSIIAETDPVVEVSKPDDSIMIFYGSVPLKSKAVTDRTVVSISLLVVSKTSREMGRDKKNPGGGIVHTNGYSAFVSSHSGHASLVHLVFSSCDFHGWEVCLPS